MAERELATLRRTILARPTWSAPRLAVALFLRGTTVLVAGRAAVVVGTILSAANQCSIIPAGHANWATWVRAVNYLKQFVVASLGYLVGCRVDTTPPASTAISARRGGWTMLTGFPVQGPGDPVGSDGSDEGRV